MFEKKPELNSEDHNLQDGLKELLNFNSEDTTNLQLDFESFRSWIQPAIQRRAMEIQAKKKRRNEVIQLAIGYGFAIILTPLLILDFWVNGWRGETVAVFLFISLFSLIMLGCSPLLVKFKKTH